MHRINRRELIKAFGFAGLVASGLISRRSWAADATFPRRLILFFIPGNFFADQWSTPGAANGVPLTNLNFQGVLSPLNSEYADLRQHLNILDGVTMSYCPEGKTSDNPYADAHHNGIRAALRGRPIVTSTPGVYPNMSIDRVIGQNLFLDRAPPPTLKNANLNVLLGNYGYQAAISEACSGGSSLESVGLPALWDSVFRDFVPPAGGGGGTPDAGSGTVMPPPGPSAELTARHQRQNLLANLTRSDLKRLKQQLGKAEAETLEQHLAAMESITQDVNREYDAAKAAQASFDAGTPMQPMTTMPAQGTIPPRASAIDAQYNLFAANQTAARVIANAMAFDRVRVAVIHPFGHNNNASFWYPGSTGAFHDGVHHSRNPAVSLAAMTVMTRMFFEIMKVLKSIPENGGSLLDSTTVATFSDMSNGDHSMGKGLYMLGGGGGYNSTGQKYFNTGRWVKFANRANTDYLVTLAHAMGVTRTRDASGATRNMEQIGIPSTNTGPIGGLTN